MAWNKLLPASSTKIRLAPAVIQANWDALEVALAKDHVIMSDADAGLHAKITLNDVAAPGAPANPVSYIYSKDVGGVSQLHFRNATAEAQISGPFNRAGVGSTALYGGLTIKWGSFVFSLGATSQTVSFATAFPVQCFSVLLTPINIVQSTLRVTAGSLAAASFAVQRNSSENFSVEIYYLAIGE